MIHSCTAAGQHSSDGETHNSQPVTINREAATYEPLDVRTQRPVIYQQIGLHLPPEDHKYCDVNDDCHYYMTPI